MGTSYVIVILVFRSAKRKSGRLTRAEFMQCTILRIMNITIITLNYIYIYIYIYIYTYVIVEEAEPLT